MKLLEEVTLQDTVEIRATPGRIFDFLVHLEENYTAWHPEDHVSFRWIKGNAWEEGSVAYTEEYLHGKLHKLKFLVTRMVPEREIAYAPLSRILRIYFPGNRFSIEPRGETSLFTATASIRVGWLVKKFASGKLEHGLSSVRKHMKEEGENLKRILEGRGE
jgi:hypothetical protein